MEFIWLKPPLDEDHRDRTEGVEYMLDITWHTGAVTDDTFYGTPKHKIELPVEVVENLSIIPVSFKTTR